MERYEAVKRIAAEILAEHSSVSASQAVGILAGETGHATPKVDVRGVVLKDDEVLLVKNGSGIISAFDEDFGVGWAFRLYDEDVLNVLQCESVQSGSPGELGGLVYYTDIKRTEHRVYHVRKAI